MSDDDQNAEALVAAVNRALSAMERASAAAIAAGNLDLSHELVGAKRSLVLALTRFAFGDDDSVPS